MFHYLRIAILAAAFGALITITFMITIAFGEEPSHLMYASPLRIEEPLEQEPPIEITVEKWTADDDIAADYWEEQYDLEFLDALDEAARALSPQPTE